VAETAFQVLGFFKNRKHYNQLSTYINFLTR
jgi:uncharacterized protein YozE (UPF0346 family)